MQEEYLSHPKAGLVLLTVMPFHPHWILTLMFKMPPLSNVNNKSKFIVTAW